MKPVMHHWRQLRWPLLALGASLLSAASLLLASHQQRTDAQQLLQRQQATLSQARERYRTLLDERETISQYLPAYQELIQQGFIGEAPRLRWVGALREIRQRHRLFDIGYDLGAQRDDSPIAALDPGKFRLHRVPMKLDFDLLHEFDLLTLLHGLRAHGNPLFMLRDCIIERRPSSALHAACELEWLTVSEPQAGPS